MSTFTAQAWLRPVHSFPATTVPKVGTPVRMPWKLSLFLLVIFAVAQPFDSLHSLPEAGLDLSETVARVERGSIQRPVAMLALGIFAALMLLSKSSGRLSIQGLLGWSVLSYVGLALASPLWAEDPFLTLRRSVLLALMALGALAVAVRFSRAQVVALTVCICSITLAISMATQIAIAGLSPFSEQWRFGGVLHPVVQGWNCGLLVLASLTMSALIPRNRKWFVFLAAMAMTCLLLTKSRMPLASTIIGSVVLGFLVLPPRVRSRILVPTFFMLVSVCLLVALVPHDPGSLATRVAALGRGEEAELSLSTFTGRVNIWGEALAYAGKRPLLGYGYDSFLGPRHLPSISGASGWVFLSLHSGYIETLLGLGYIGTVSLVISLLWAVKRSLKLSKCGPPFAFAAAVITWLVCNLFTESNVITEPAFPMFLSFVVVGQLIVRSQQQLPAMLDPSPTA